MSRDIKINESPNHFMVLDAISRGMKTADKISKVTKLDRSEVELIVNDLTVQRLLSRIEKKGLFRKKVEFVINETGQRLLDVKKRDLEQKAKELQQAYGNGNTAQLQSFMDADRAWVPMMIFSGLMNVMFFASMMSFMGMAMSPQESSMAGDAGGGSESATEASDTAETGTDSSGEGAFDGGGSDSFGDAGMDFGGDFNF